MPNEISETEYEILKVIGRFPDQTVYNIEKKLNGVAYNSIKHWISKLLKKQLINATKKDGVTTFSLTDKVTVKNGAVKIEMNDLILIFTSPDTLISKLFENGKEDNGDKK